MPKLTTNELAKDAIRCNIDLNQAFNYGLAGKNIEFIENLEQVIIYINSIIEKSKPKKNT